MHLQFCTRMFMIFRWLEPFLSILAGSYRIVLRRVQRSDFDVPSHFSRQMCKCICFLGCRCDIRYLRSNCTVESSRVSCLERRKKGIGRRGFYMLHPRNIFVLRIFSTGSLKKLLFLRVAVCCAFALCRLASVAGRGRPRGQQWTNGTFAHSLFSWYLLVREGHNEASIVFR